MEFIEIVMSNCMYWLINSRWLLVQVGLKWLQVICTTFNGQFRWLSCLVWHWLSNLYISIESVFFDLDLSTKLHIQYAKHTMESLSPGKAPKVGKFLNHKPELESNLNLNETIILEKRSLKTPVYSSYCMTKWSREYLTKKCWG